MCIFQAKLTFWFAFGCTKKLACVPHRRPPFWCSWPARKLKLLFKTIFFKPCRACTPGISHGVMSEERLLCPPQDMILRSWSNLNRVPNQSRKSAQSPSPPFRSGGLFRLFSGPSYGKRAEPNFAVLNIGMQIVLGPSFWKWLQNILGCFFFFPKMAIPEPIFPKDFSRFFSFDFGSWILFYFSLTGKGHADLLRNSSGSEAGNCRWYCASK